MYWKYHEAERWIPNLFRMIPAILIYRRKPSAISAVDLEAMGKPSKSNKKGIPVSLFLEEQFLMFFESMSVDAYF